MNRLENLVGAGVIVISGLLSTPAFAKVTQSPFPEANKRMKSAEICFKQKDYHSARIYARDAFGAHPGTNEPEDWKDLLTQIYKKRLNEIFDSNGGYITEETDMILFEIPKYNNNIKDVQICALLACRSTDMKERRKWFNRSMILDKNAAKAAYEFYAGKNWKENLKL